MKDDYPNEWDTEVYDDKGVVRTHTLTRKEIIDAAKERIEPRSNQSEHFGTCPFGEAPTSGDCHSNEHRRKGKKKRKKNESPKNIDSIIRKITEN